jgi:hypothetical protein
MSPVVALSGHRTVVHECPLLGVKRTSLFHSVMSAFDPKRTSALLPHLPYPTVRFTCVAAFHRAAMDSMKLAPSMTTVRNLVEIRIVPLTCALDAWLCCCFALAASVEVSTGLGWGYYGA